MSLPTLDELQDSGVSRFLFPPDNAVPYWMDFASWEGLPSDRVFYLDATEKAPHARVTLRASGYGVAGDYGNGSVFMKAEYLPPKLPD